MMAYMMIETTITDEAQFGRYRQAVLPLIETFGGKHITGGAVEHLEGQQDDCRDRDGTLPL